MKYKDNFHHIINKRDKFGNVNNYKSKNPDVFRHKDKNVRKFVNKLYSVDKYWTKSLSKNEIMELFRMWEMNNFFLDSSKNTRRYKRNHNFWFVIGKDGFYENIEEFVKFKKLSFGSDKKTRDFKLRDLLK